MAATWTTHPERGNAAILRFFVRLALTIGRPLARALLVPIVLYFLFAGGAARAASRDYLARVLGREPTVVDGFRHVHAFASAILDRLYLLHGHHSLFRIRSYGDALMQRRMAVHNAETGARRGLFVIGAHFGSFEAARAAGRAQEGLRVSMVMYEDNAQSYNSVASAIDPRLAEDVIALGRVDSMLRVKHALDDGGLVGMLADRTLAEEDGTPAVREATLLGGRVSIPTGPFRMAAMLRRPAIFIAGVYRGGDRYDVYYEELFDFSTLEGCAPAERASAASAASAAIDEAIARYVGKLEHHCRDAPYNWFNFYDYWNDAARPGTHQAKRRGDRDDGGRA